MVVISNFQDIFNSLPKNISFNLPVCKENSLEISYGKDDDAKALYSGSAPVLPFANSEVFNANILAWRRLTALNGDCKAVYELTFDIHDSNFSFKAGDTIGIIPSNNKADVNLILSHLDLTPTADLRYTLSEGNSKISKIPAHVPVKSTLRDVLTHCVDLRSVLKKLFILALSRHTKEEHERRILEYFSSKEGANAYQNHILNKNLCILDIFTIFKSCKPPIQILLANLPRLLPRPYSIVNSGLKNKNHLKICFSVTEKENNRKGLTTGWLESLILNKENLENRMSNLAIDNCDCDMYRVPIYLRKNISGFSLPESMEKPIVLIGPGTGVAPFMAFLEERECFKRNNPCKSIGDVWLFFGCRDPQLDFIYEKQLNEFLEGGVLSKLVTAFSRVENSEAKYIQDALEQHHEEIDNLIESEASIFVCGDLKNMAAQVEESIIKCLVCSGKSINEASAIVSEMINQKKYIVDAWS